VKQLGRRLAIVLACAAAYEWFVVEAIRSEAIAAVAVGIAVLLMFECQGLGVVCDRCGGGVGQRIGAAESKPRGKKGGPMPVNFSTACNAQAMVDTWEHLPRKIAHV
jgi:hypothetical protein